ncbi:MAG: hypothetical protein ABIS47_02705 [Acidimicrobiales bacterium]
MALLDLAVAMGGVVAAALAGWRWLRVAQREGWAPGSASRWAARWWTLDANAAVAAVAVLSLAVTPVFRPAGLAAALAVAAGPPGLPLRGRRPGPLAWTSRARRAAASGAALGLVVVGAGLVVGTGTAAVLSVLVAVLAPVLVDVGALAAGGAQPAEGVVATGIEPSAALARLAGRPAAAKRVLVTAGPRGAAGEALAERAVAVSTHLLLVGRHARAALQRGAARGPAGCTVVLCHDVDHAEAWLRAETAPADVVVWLAIPPDHVP